MNSTNVRSIPNMKKNWQAQIDQETWMELTRSFERVVDTLGMIAPVLELSKDKSEHEKSRYFRAVTDLAFNGHRALRAFSQRWAVVQEGNLKGWSTKDSVDFSDIYPCAHQNSSSDPPSILDSARRKTDAAQTGPL